MAQLPAWLVYGPAIATIFSGIVVSTAGLVFTYLQWKFAKDHPKRDLEAHRRALNATKHERLIADYAVILRSSIAHKEYIRLQNVVIPGKDPKEQEKQLLDFLHAESEGLTLAFASGSLAMCNGIADPFVIAHRTNTSRQHILGSSS
jgi:hypothetical protein